MPPCSRADGLIRADRSLLPDEAPLLPLPGEEGEAGVEAHPLSASRAEALCRSLREAKAPFSHRDVVKIADVLDAVSRRWLDPSFPPRREVISAISSRSGWSSEQVGFSLNREMETSLKADLLGAVEEELGSLEVLSRWVRQGDRERRAFGPRLVLGVSSGNIPGLPHLTVMRSLLVGSPVLVKVSRQEPVFLARYWDTLWEEDPVLAACVAVQAWKGGDREVEDVLLAEADFLIAYGGEASLSSLASRINPRTRALWHGHRTGACLIEGDATKNPQLAQALAEDACIHEQEACLSPAWVFIAATEDDAIHLADQVHDALHHLTAERPPPRREPADLAFRRSALESLVAEDLANPGSLVHARKGEGLSHLVVVRRGLPQRPVMPRGRVVSLHVVSTLEEVIAFLARHPHRLQVASIQAPPSRFAFLSQALAEAGVTRICPPGTMGVPDMRWRHDGRPCIGEMVRWVERPWTWSPRKG